MSNHVPTSTDKQKVNPHDALQIKLTNYFTQNNSFTDPRFSIENLVTALNTNKKVMNDTIQQNGFSGFKEFLNYLRVEHFKKLAAKSPSSSVITLMYQCGYTSRTTFYRQFAEFEQMSPKEYIKNIARKPSSNLKPIKSTISTRWTSQSIPPKVHLRFSYRIYASYLSHS